MAQTRGRFRPWGHRSTQRVVQALLLYVMASALTPTALAAGPDTSARSFIKLDSLGTTSIGSEVLEVIHTQPTAAAASAWALVGNSNLSYEAHILGACCTDYDYAINPVIVTGPFDGNPYATLNLYPPPLANPAAVERFGAALAIHADRIAVGSTEVLTESLFPIWPYTPRWFSTAGGRVHLYLHNGTTFLHERTVVYGGTGERFGQAVDLRLNTLLVGRPRATPGAADLFDSATGDHITTLTSPASGNKFGETVALLDDLALVGASGSGTVYVYRHDGAGNWTPAGTLTSPGASSQFGAAIDVDNGRILVGAPAIDRAYVFEDDGDANWPVLAEIAGGVGSRLGQAVALTGDTAFIGAPQVLFGGGNRIGLVVRHERATDGTWPYVGYKASRGPKNGDGFGTLVSASSTLLSVAQNGDYTRPSEFYIYSSQASIWDGDSDTVSDYGDNCVAAYNPGQEDVDGDDSGDICDPDIDNDGLLNTEEANSGTDPYNPDTDGDGLNDGDDPYPTNPDIDGDGASDSLDNCREISNPDQGNVDGDVYGDVCDANIDGDPLSNDAEATLGTNPYNPDTDGDLHRDGEDFLPLDSKDGWANKYQFQVDAGQMGLGKEVLLVLTGDNQTLRSFAKVSGVWSEVTAPVIPGNLLLKLYGGGTSGNQFVVLARGAGSTLERIFYVLDWSPSGGWVRHGPVDLTGFVHNLLNAAVGQDKIVIQAYPLGGGANQDLVFDITPTGPVFREVAPAIDQISPASRSIAGNYLFSIRPNDARITAYNMLNGYSNQVITWPNPTQGGQLGTGFYPVGPNKVFVDAEQNSFWMSLVNGVWNLELSGISKWSYQSGHISGGDGTVVVHTLDPAAQSGVALYRVQRVSNASEVGKFNAWSQGSSRIQTNGNVVVQARVYTSGTRVVDIFEVPAAPPPGC